MSRNTLTAILAICLTVLGASGMLAWAILHRAQSSATQTIVPAQTNPSTIALDSGAPVASVQASFDRYSVRDVFLAFQAGGVELGAISTLEPNQQGAAPLTEKEAGRFLIPSLGPDNGGRVFTFRSEQDLQIKKEYFERLGRASAMAFSWLFQRDNILVQINGSLSREKARTYKAALDHLPQR